MRADPVNPVDRGELRLALVGWGAINRAAVAGLAAEPVRVVAVARRDWSGGSHDLPASATAITDPSELAATRPDLVVEAASRESVGEWGRAALTAGIDFVVTSVSAFADPDLLAELGGLATLNRARIHIHPGALGGIDALAAARRAGIDRVEHRIVKPPRAWIGTPAEEMCRLEELAAATEFFAASATRAATLFPKNANVAMTTALAGIGPDLTRIVLVADPGAATNRHAITAEGPFGRLDVSISSAPLPGNPKTSAMAAHSLVRAIVNRASAIAI